MEVYIAVPVPRPSPPSITDTSSSITPTQIAPTPSPTIAYGPIGSGLMITSAGTTSSEGDTIQTNFPSAITVTTIKYGEVAQRSQGSVGVRPGFGLTNWPVLGVVILTTALVSSCIMESCVF